MGRVAPFYKCGDCKTMKKIDEVSKISSTIIGIIADGLRGNIPDGDIVAIVNTYILNYTKEQVDKERKVSKKQAMLKGVDYVACSFKIHYDGEDGYAKELYVKMMKEAREAINELE